MSEWLHVGPISIDLEARVVWVDEERIPITRMEYELLTTMAQKPYRVYTKEELLRDVWGFKSEPKTRTADTTVSRLRRKLKAAGAGDVLDNFWAVGWRLLAPARVASGVSA